MLASLGARPFDSLRDASSGLQDLARDDGTMVMLVRNVRRNIEIPEPGVAAQVPAAAAVPGKAPPAEPSAGIVVVEELSGPFKALNKLFAQAANGKEGSWFEQYRKSIAAIQKDIAKLAAASDVPRDTRQFAAKLLDGDSESELYRSWLAVSQGLEDADARTVDSLSNLLRAPIRNVWSMIIVVAQKDLDRTWKNQVYFAFRESLAGRYPFAREGQDASMRDIGEFFRTGGTLSTFVNQDLRPFVERKGKSWEARSWLGIGMDFNPDFLRVMERTALILTTMFKPGDSTPNMGFGVYPMPNPALSESALNVDGAEYRYRNGPQEWQSFTWPGSNPSARVRGVRAGSLASGELYVEGPWGFLRLLSQAQLTHRSDGSFVAAWSLRDSSGQRMTVSFQIRPDRYANPFGRNALQGYGLPAEMFAHSQPATDILRLGATGMERANGR
jgi:type VI secretion system protein ImpL